MRAGADTYPALRRLMVAALACLAGVLGAPAGAGAVTTTFTGGDAADPDGWHSAANWDNGVPGPGDDAVIPAGRAAVVRTMPASARSLDIVGVPRGVPNPGRLTVEGTAVSLAVGAGRSSIAGALRIEDGATVELGGTTTYGPEGSIAVDSSTLRNAGTLSVPTDRHISTFGIALVHNTGTIELASGTGTFAVGQLDNDGLVEIDAGTFFHNGPGAGTSSGRFVLAAGTVLAFNAPFTIGGAGSGIEGDAGEVQTTNADARVRVAADAVFDPGGVRLKGGQITVAPDAEIEHLVPAGVYEGLGDLTVTDSFTATGRMVGAGSTRLLGSVEFTSGVTVTEGHTLRLPAASTTTMSSPGISLANGATLETPGRLELLDGASIGDSNNGTPNAVVNTGTIVRGPGTGTALIQPRLRNSGTVLVESATLQLAGHGLVQTAGTTDVRSGATLHGTLTPSRWTLSLQGGVLTGGGRVSGHVANTGGEVRPGASPGILSVGGSYTQGRGGLLEAEIAGTAPGTGYDQLQVAGAVTLDGTLAIANASGFTPAEADRFAIVSAGGTLSGAFSTLTGASIPAGTYQVAYTTPAPGAATLALVAAPVNTDAPSIPAEGRTGDTVTCDPGTWTGSPALSYEWLRDGTPISGATQQSYTLTAADEGHAIVCRVSAGNAGGTTTADSNTLSAQAPPAPPAPPSPTPAPAPGPVGDPEPVPDNSPPVEPPAPPRQVALTDLGDECLPVGNFRYRFTIPLKRLFRGLRVNRRSRVRDVRFMLDGTAIGRDRRRPYVAQIDATGLAPGRHRLDAVVTLRVPPPRGRRHRTLTRRQTYRFDACSGSPAAPGVRASDLVSLPSQDRCIRGGRVRVLARHAGGAEIRSVRIAASGGARDRIEITQADRRWRITHNRRLLARARGANARVVIRLARPPRRPFTLRAAIETLAGDRLTITRRYEPCRSR